MKEQFENREDLLKSNSLYVWIYVAKVFLTMPMLILNVIVVMKSGLLRGIKVKDESELRYHLAMSLLLPKALGLGDYAFSHAKAGRSRLWFFKTPLASTPNQVAFKNLLIWFDLKEEHLHLQTLDEMKEIKKKDVKNENMILVKMPNFGFDSDDCTDYLQKLLDAWKTCDENLYKQLSPSEERPREKLRFRSSNEQSQESKEDDNELGPDCEIKRGKPMDV